MAEAAVEGQPLSPAMAQRADLRRTRWLATGLLGLMLVVYAAASFGRSAFPWLAYPRAFAEAGIVGACADWFAVTALFRRPFGLPIPHTAIIPRQKQRIGEALGRFISSNFLAPAEVTRRIDRLDAAGWLAHWLMDPANIQMISRRSQGLLPPLMDLAGEGRVRAFSRGLIVQGIDSVAVAPLAARTLSVLVRQGYFDTVFDFALDRARNFLGAHREDLLRRVGRAGSSWIPGWLDVRLAEGILNELLATIAKARSEPDHAWRVLGRSTTNRFIARLASDPDLFERCERIKAEVLDATVVEGYLEWLGGELEGRLRDELQRDNPVVAGWLEHALPAVGTWLEGDAHIRDLLNDWARKLVLSTVVAGRDEIGAFVAGVVDRWDTHTLVDRLELQVGRDLQFIRLNGTLVGGLVGLVLFTLTRWMG